MVMSRIDLFNIDCLEYMRTCKDNQFDLAIVDPPYGINADEKNSKKEFKSKKSATLSKYYGNQKWDANVPEQSYFKELIRISKNQIIWGVNYYPYNFLNGGRIYWDKCVTMPTYSDGELAFISKINSIQSYRYAWHGMIQQNMKNKEVRIHPTQKPVALYKWLLRNYAKENDLIFDSHLGSESIAIACHDLGFDLIGCEIDNDYYNDALTRLNNHKKQQFIL